VRHGAWCACTLWTATLLLVAPAARPQAPDAGGPASWHVGQQVDLLYASQVHFDSAGVPQVTIGMAEGLQGVELSAAGGLSIEFVEDAGGVAGVEKKLRLPAAARLIVSSAGAHPAEVAYYCGVQRLPYGKRREVEQQRRWWSQRGEQVSIFETGSVLGLAGQVIDNRTFILAVRRVDTAEQAAATARELFSATGRKTFVHAHLLRRPGGLLDLRDADGLPLARARDLVLVRAVAAEVAVVAVAGDGGRRSFSLAGEVLITFDRTGKLVVVNRIGIEKLLAGLVPAEISAQVHPQALRAQAVVARGEVFAKLGARHFLDPYLLCASTHCQVYGGSGVENERASAAVRATRGEILFLNGKLVDTVYSASCGGHGENNDDVWSDPPSPALRGHPDVAAGLTLLLPPADEDPRAWLEAEVPAFCRRSSLNRPGIFRWEKVVDARKLEELVAEVKPVGKVMALQVLERGVSGRAKVLRVVGTRGELVIQRELAIRRLLGGLKSALFVLQVERDAQQLPVAFHFLGGGWGHGVGLCQIGAVGMAEAGYDYRAILAHYYGGARVVRLYGNRSP